MLPTDARGRSLRRSAPFAAIAAFALISAGAADSAWSRPTWGAATLLMLAAGGLAAAPEHRFGPRSVLSAVGTTCSRSPCFAT